MSITFTIEGREPDFGDREDRDPGQPFVNLANANARDVLNYLGYPSGDRDLYGQIHAPELAERCRERLRPVRANVDPARPQREGKGEGGARFITCGRAEGYLQDKAELLLELAEEAGDGWINYA